MIFIVGISYLLVKVDQNEENNHQRTQQIKLHENDMCLQVMFSDQAVVFVVFCHFHKCVLTHSRIKGEAGAVILV